MFETLGYLVAEWLINVSLNAAIQEEPRPLCYVEETINEKITHVPHYCDEL